jgi:hypothetical protein
VGSKPGAVSCDVRWNALQQASGKFAANLHLWFLLAGRSEKA